eukprot:564578-Rhodomonas_salina.3
MLHRAPDIDHTRTHHLRVRCPGTVESCLLVAPVHRQVQRQEDADYRTLLVAAWAAEAKR